MTDIRDEGIEILRVLKQGGVVIITASGIGFPLHEYPNDFWRFTAAGLKILLKDFVKIEVLGDRDAVYGVAYKSNAEEGRGA